MIKVASQNGGGVGRGGGSEMEGLYTFIKPYNKIQRAQLF